MRLNRWLWLGLGLAGLHGAPARAGDPVWGLPQLMQGLARVRAASAQFAERRTVPMLNAPLLSYGSLTYLAPDYVRKITTSPLPQIFLLDHGEVTLSGGPDHRTQHFSLAEAPQIGGLVEGIRATLAGDLPALERVYRVQLRGGAAGWQLFLRPRDPGVARFVTSIIIQGQDDRILAVDTVSGDGGHSEMGITEDRRDGP